MTDDVHIDPVLKGLVGSRCGIVLDIDETILNPLPLYHERINEAMSLQITVKQIEEAGGLDGFFKNDSRYNEFKRIADFLRADPTFNSDVPLVEGAREGVAALGSTAGVVVAAYLTTRPSAVTAVTISDLFTKGFPLAPVLARPAEVVRESTIEWKLSVLRRLNDHYDGRVVSVDDSVALARAINAANKKSSRAIVAVLYLGPLTYTTVAVEHIESDPAAHFFVATWENIPSICQQYA